MMKLMNNCLFFKVLESEKENRMPKKQVIFLVFEKKYLICSEEPCGSV